MEENKTVSNARANEIIKELKELTDSVCGFWEPDGSSELESMGLGAPEAKDEGIEYTYEELKEIYKKIKEIDSRK